MRNGFAYKSADYQSSGIPILRISDIDGNRAHPSQNVFLPAEQFDAKFVVEAGDILIAMSGATTGKIGVYEYDFPSLQNQRVGNLKITRPDKILSGFRNLLFHSLSATILEAAYGGAQPNISSKDIEAQAVSLPPLPEQAEIVRRVEALFTIADRLEQRYVEALKSFHSLTPALLAKAFRGELVPQDPADEPASVLLDRIRAQRSVTGEKPKRGRGAGGAAKQAKAESGSEEPKRRGRPAKIPSASSVEDAIARLEAKKEAASEVVRAEGTRQVSLFED